MRIALALLAILAAFPAAAVAAQPGQEASAVSAAATELAGLVMPVDAYVEREVRYARAGFIGIVQSDPDAKALEEEFPGIYEHGWKVVEPELRRYSREEHPRLLTRLAAVYQRHLTSDEMATLRTFYLSPTGQRVLRTMYEEADAAPFVESMLATPDYAISAEAVKAARDAGKAKVMAQVGPQDEAAGRALLQGISLEKMNTLSQAVQALTVEWANEPDPAFDARMEKLLTAAAERYMEQNATGDR